MNDGLDDNLDELDAALSDARHQSPENNHHQHHQQHRGPHGVGGGGRRTAPSTRRGSLVPGSLGLGVGSGGGAAAAATTASASRRKRHRLDDLNLFTFDRRELVRAMLLTSGESCVSYHEYAVFAPPPEGEAPGGEGGEPRSPSIMSDGEEGLRMFREALRRGYSLDNEGNFTAGAKGKRLLQGRVRQVIAHRRLRYGSPDSPSSVPDGLELTIDDYESLGLHSGTLPALQRVTSESSIWDAKKETLHLIFSFSSHPQPPYDFLSMKYDLRSRTATALIRRSFDTRWHDEDALDEYEKRLDSCRGRWSHPLVLPVVLLQVQLFRTEEAVQSNNGEVLFLEAHVDAVTGTTGQANAEAWRRNRKARSDSKAHRFGPLKRLSTLRDMVEERVGSGSRSQVQAPSPVASFFEPDYVPPQTIHLMKEAHDVLKGAIQLLDTLRWMERAVKLLIQIGDELDARMNDMKEQSEAKGGPGPEGDYDDEEMSYHWHEIRQYLDCTSRLCTSLETDRRMSELRCRAQIDIIYSKMAQEDNNLNARMAVASTRDSSSMKALAVITAIFLPGEYIGTLFGVSMFNWEWGTAGDPGASADAVDGWPHPVIMPSFWVYWAFTIPLTLFIVTLWRAWWVNQDRYFRRHLSNELSNERYWTTDGKPRELETTFTQDFFSLFSRSGARSATNSTILGPAAKSREPDGSAAFSPGLGPGAFRRGTALSQSASMAKEVTDSEGEGVVRGMRFRQISFAQPPQQRDQVSAV
ncbi:hypothetical protein F5Y15DRAFT_349293 [Xylariaceae sp. FL0016]|nr:hypothetical protein F5Y15DRAFT_349293 [Xylariaceae sp. FL0016]